MPAATGFDIARSQVTADKLAEWLQEEISDDISQVPGIGPAAVKNLAKEQDGDPGVTTTWQLIGKFLMMKGAGFEKQTHCDAMWHWLDSKGVSSHRAGIVCVCSAAAL